MNKEYKRRENTQRKANDPNTRTPKHNHRPSLSQKLAMDLKTLNFANATHSAPPDVANDIRMQEMPKMQKYQRKMPEW